MMSTIRQQIQSLQGMNLAHACVCKRFTLRDQKTHLVRGEMRRVVEVAEAVMYMAKKDTCVCQ